MTEYIDRDDLIRNLRRFAPEHFSALVNSLVIQQPAADVVPREVEQNNAQAAYAKGYEDGQKNKHGKWMSEVVRCRACDAYDEGYCAYWRGNTGSEDFCSRGWKDGEIH